MKFKNYNLNKIVCIFILFLWSVPINSQVSTNHEKHKTLALATLFTEGLNQSNIEISREKLKEFLSTGVEVLEIKQDDFEGFTFLKIIPIEESVSESRADEVLPVIWNSCEEYIIAISQGNYVFKLKGFQVNDFFSFLRLIRENSNKRNKKRFIKKHKIKGLDFECLFNSLKSNNSKEDIKKYPCISNTCFEVFTFY